MKHKEQSRQALAQLRVLAERHKITLVQLADELQVRPQTVGQTMRGQFHPTLDRVFLFINAINKIAGQRYSLADLLDGEKPK